MSKPVEKLLPDKQIIFNGGIVQTNGTEITIKPKNQGDKIQLIDSNIAFKDLYVAQRARGAYIATICQLEATFDLSFAAQISQNPSEEDVRLLNKRLEWQMMNKNKGLRFIKLGLNSAKLFVFVDASFANNKDFSSQIRFVIIPANEKNAVSESEENFHISGNMIHWSSIKAKRVTRSVLASELYATVHGFDSGISIKNTIDGIMKQLKVPQILLILYTDSRSLYDCLIKLGKTDEKRLMIDLLTLRQSYEQREIAEIR